MSEEKDPNYGELVMGNGLVYPDGVVIQLPAEFRDGGVLNFSTSVAIGWEHNGVLHYLPGKGPQDHPGWTWEGEVAE
jgi:hypothetical protein